MAPLAWAMALGILVDRFWSPFETTTWTTFSAILGLLALILNRWRWVSNLSIFLAVLAIGGGYHHFRWTDLPDNHLAHFIDTDEPRPAWVQGVLIGVPTYRPAGNWPGSEGVTSTELAITAISDGQAWQAVSGKALLSIGGNRTDLRAGEPVEAAGSLARLAAPRNPGEPDRRLAPLAQGIRLRLTIGDSAGIWPDPEGESWPWSRWRGMARTWSYQQLIAKLDPKTAPMAAALLLGRRRGVDPDINDAFVRTGTTHLLAISGLHLQALAGALFLCCRLLGLRRKSSFALVLISSLAYATLVGWMPSVARSTAMTVGICLAGLLDRYSRPSNLLALAALLTLSINPAYLFQAGWQLSFLAVAVIFWVALPILRQLGIAAPDGELRIYALTLQRRSTVDPLDALERQLEPAWEAGLRMVWGGLASLLIVSVVVSIACAPLIAWWFHLVSPIGILLNVPLVPIITLAMLSAGATLPLSIAWNPLGQPMVWIYEQLISAAMFLVRWGESQPGAFVYVPSPPTWTLFAFYASLAFAAWTLVIQAPALLRRTSWALVAVFGVLIVALTFQAPGPERLAVDVLAVDHGLAVLIQGSDGRTILYDCGKMLDPGVGRRIIAPVLWSRGLTRIQEVILSHSDSDHYNGLPDLLERFTIEKVRISADFIQGDNPGATRLLETLRAQGVAIESISAGEQIDLGGGAIAEVLHPASGWLPGASGNDRSVVLDLSMEGRHLLLTGDLDGSGLAEILALPSRPFDAVLAPHHGGRSANPPWFYDWATPKVVTVSQARPRFGTRDPLDEAGLNDVRILRTWERGAILFRWEPSRLMVQGFLDQDQEQNHSSKIWVRGLVGFSGFLVGLTTWFLLVILEWGAWVLVVPGRRLASMVPLPAPWESIEIQASDGVKLRAWWRASDRASGRSAILLHGFGETGPALQDRADLLQRWGWNVLIPDARAFGRSDGDRASFGGREADDLLQWLDALAVRVGPELLPIAWGRSMGAAIALRAAAEQNHRLAALILEAPYADLERTLAAWLSRDRLPSGLAGAILWRSKMLAGVSLSHPRPIDLAPQIEAPVLILQGALDQVVAPGETQRLAQAFSHPPAIFQVAGAGHADVFSKGGPPMLEQIERFLTKASASGKKDDNRGQDDADSSGH